MLVECATEAEIMSTFAMYAGHDLLELSLFNVAIYGIHTVWRRAPFKILEIVNVRSGEQFVIPVG